MFKGFNNRQQNGFPNLNFSSDKSAYNQNGCTFWLRADFGLNTQTNGGSISSWTDSISGVAFSQSTLANQPVLRTSQASYNNLPVVDFLAAGTGTLIGPVTLFNTIAFIANYDSIGNRNAILSLNSTNGIFLGGTATGYNGVSIQNNGTVTSGSTESTSVKIVVISNNLIMVNGVVEASTSFNIAFGFSLLGSIVGGAGGFLGKCAEIICFEQSLNQNQALELSNNINTKYAIY
jgi:hypothetical protein